MRFLGMPALWGGLMSASVAAADMDAFFADAFTYALESQA